jgi:SAM-dependent methyltransferase
MSDLRACRICGSTAITQRGDVEYLQGLRCVIYDCGGCGCRFTPHQSGVHDRMHQQPSISYYADYIALADRCAALFRAKDLDGIRSELSAAGAKYRFVIEHIDRAPQTAKLLEIGCARGHLTSYAILANRDVRGVDISPAAIGTAKALFGDHFAVAETTQASAGSPFDMIYHVGLIGCVADPIGLTRHLLGLLRPGGELIFNAPNREALQWRGQLWFDSAPPPELITLFPEGFWRRRFSDAAHVTEAIDHVDADASLRMAVRRLLGIRWQPPVAQPLTAHASRWSQPAAGARHLAERVISKAARAFGLSSVVTSRPSEYGMFVRMVKPA